MKYISESENQTIEFGRKFAEALTSKDVIVFTGDLGAGKTKFIYGIAGYFGVESEVSSPTFTIVNEYDVILPNKNNVEKIFHFDVYRLCGSEDFENSVGTDYFSNGLCLIEWGEHISEILPKNTIYVNIQKLDETKREFEITNMEVI